MGAYKLLKLERTRAGFLQLLQNFWFTIFIGLQIRLELVLNKYTFSLLFKKLLVIRRRTVHQLANVFMALYLCFQELMTSTCSRKFDLFMVLGTVQVPKVKRRFVSGRYLHSVYVVDCLSFGGIRLQC